MENLRQSLLVLVASNITGATSLPLPLDAQWEEACHADDSIALLISELTKGTTLDRKQFQEKKYFTEFCNQRLEFKGGIVY